MFHQDVMINAVQTMIIDYFEIHAHIYKETEQSTQTTQVMSDFLALLERGDYREHRDIAYYADLLCVTPKYLSEVSKKSSGMGANFWINRFTILEISRLLRDKTISFTEITDMFNFSSTSYFSRYVQNNLGVSPSAYRG
jgi:AraC-like DNA-binding protein